MHKEQIFLAMLEAYLTRFPYNEVLLYHYYVELDPETKLVDFDSFDTWFEKNKESQIVLSVFNKHEDQIKKLIQNRRNEINLERGKVKFMMPTLASVEEPISLFDN